MSELDSIKRMADHYPGGYKAVALRLLKPHETLRKELAGAHGFKLGLIDAMAIVRMCHEVHSEHSLLFAVEVAATHDMCLSPIDMTDVCSGNVLQNATSSMRASTDLASEILERIADGELCDNDMRVIEKAYADAVKSKQAVMRSARTNHAAGKAKRSKAHQ